MNMVAITKPTPAAPMTPAHLLRHFSLEITTRDTPKLEEAAHLIPPGTQVSVTFLPNESFDDRINAASAVKQLGLIPVSHISARRLQSAAELESFLDRLASLNCLDKVFVIAGDGANAEGPYPDALTVIKSGLLEKYGVNHVGIAGYPEGHPDISPDKLWQALHDKKAALDDLGLDFSIVTQFGFDVERITAWLAELRAQGVAAPVRLGVAGPASVGTLLRFAARCGVAASAKVMAKYGISITRLMNTAGPDPIIEDLARHLEPAIHGETLLHFYPFGGLVKTAAWVKASVR
jgi:methylenetetrahydrofolate reductase (NADPH)